MHTHPKILKFGAVIGSCFLVIGLMVHWKSDGRWAGQASLEVPIPQVIGESAGGRQPLKAPALPIQSQPQLISPELDGELSAASAHLQIAAEFSVWADAFIAGDPQARAQANVLAEGERIALARRRMLKELITVHPRQALSLVVPAKIRQQLPAGIIRHLEDRVDARGSFVVLVADDFERGTSTVHRTAIISGTSYQAFVYGRRLQDKSQANVTLQGIAIDEVMAVADAVRPEAGAVAEPVEHAGTAVYGDSGGGSGTNPPVVASSWPQGPKTVLLMRVAFPDDPAEPITEPAAYAMMDQVNQFYVENSYGSTILVPDVTPLLILPQTKDGYGLLGRDVLQTDAREAARLAGFNTDVYDLDIVLFKTVAGPNFSGWNGLANIGGKGLWMQGTTSAGVAAHELGHNYGFYHANFWSANGDGIIGHGSNSEYGNPFDTMGAANAGIYHFNAAYKSELNWLTPGFVLAVTNSGNFRLHAFDVPQLVNGQNYALKIRKDYDRNYWAEFRQKFTNNAWLQNGILLNWDAWDNNTVDSAGGTDLLDTTPGTPTANSGKDDAAVVIGRTFSDPAAGIYITPVGKGSNVFGSWIDVQVNLGDFPTNLPPVLSIIADQTNVATGVPVNFSATATDPNGDTLAYYWEFGDLTFGANSPSASKSWNTVGDYVVRCTASDMNGGSAIRYIVITVGSPTTFRASGRVLTNTGDPLEGVRIHNGLSGASYRGTYSDSDGYYALVNLAANNYTLAAVKYGYVITSNGWSNPLTVGPSQSDVNWTATAGQVVRVIAADPLAARPNPSADTGMFTISRTGSLASSLNVKLNLAGTATYQTDYSLTPSLSGSPPYQITIAAGRSTTNLVLTPLNLAQTVDPQKVTLTIAENSSYSLGTFAEALITISNTQANAQSTVDVVALNDFIPEVGPQSGLLLFTRDGNLRTNLTVFYSIQGTASNGVDYLPLSGSVIIPADESTALVPVTAIQDLVVDGNETVTITILANAAYQVGASPSASLVILDESVPRVFITPTGNFPLEGSAGNGTLTVTRFGSLAANLLVSYALSGTATNGVDYNALPGSVLIPAGSPSATITVTPKQDALANGSRTVVATITSSPGYSIINPGLATVTIMDDDVPRITLAVAGATASEAGTNTGAFTFTRTGATTDPVTVFYNIFGTAINGADYALISNSIVIPAGTNSATLSISALADSIRDPGETVVLTLQTSAAYTVTTTAPQTVTIIDNNSGGLPGVGFDWAGFSGPEAGTVATILVSLSATNASTVTVNYAVSGGTATGGFVDYSLSSGSLSFSAGQTNKTFNFFVIQDSLAEANETIVISLSNPVNALRDVRSNLVFTILDDDVFGAVSVAATTPNASETGPAAGTFRFSRSQGTATNLTVAFEVTGTASSPGDFVPFGNSVTIPAGQSFVDLVVMPVEDNEPEPTESVIVTLTSAPGGSIGASNSATILIIDNDDSSSLPIVSVTTNTNFNTFTFTRDHATNNALNIGYSLTGTATNGTDYQTIPNIFTMPVGTTQADLAITPLPSGSNKTVVITLTMDGSNRVLPAVAAASLTLNTLSSSPPSISQQPTNFLAQFGGNVTNSVAASGTAPLSYQWYFNTNTPLADATNALLVLTNVQNSATGQYSVIITNSAGAITSSFVNLTINRAPVAGSVSMDRLLTNGVKLRISNLLTNATDADGDSVNLASFGTCTNGGTVTTNHGWVLYSPGSTNPDAFTYTVADGRGGQATNWVVVNPPPTTVPSPDQLLVVGTNIAQVVRFDGIPALTYRFQSTTNLVAPDWQFMATNAASPMGIILLTVPPTSGTNLIRTTYP